MKKLLALLLLISNWAIAGTTYYFDAIVPDNTSNNGLTAGAAWPLSKISGGVDNIGNGAHLLFKRGQTTAYPPTRSISSSSTFSSSFHCPFQKSAMTICLLCGYQNSITGT